MNRGVRLIVEIPWGRRGAARKATIAPGAALRVGRSEPADLVVPHDRQMSGRHFELSWDGARCLLRDEESDKGTWLNGEKVTEAEVKNNDWIRAGDTIFLVYVEGATLRLSPEDPPEVAMRKERAFAALSCEPSAA